MHAQNHFDAWAEPYGRMAMEAANLTPGQRVMDIGCGCGATTLELARRVAPTGTAVGVDISTPMLDRAKQNARDAGQANLEFLNADAQTCDFPSESSDLLFSRFGVMFFADPLWAFRNMFRALRPGARLAFVCWQSLQKNPWLWIPIVAASRHLAFRASSSGANGPAPFSFADPDRVRKILATAGFTDITLQDRDHTMPLGDLDNAANFLLRLSPISSRSAQAVPEARERVIAAVRESLTQCNTDRGVMIGSSVWIVTAHRPERG